MTTTGSQSVPRADLSRYEPSSTTRRRTALQWLRAEVDCELDRFDAALIDHGHGDEGAQIAARHRAGLNTASVLDLVLLLATLREQNREHELCQVLAGRVA